MPDDGHSHSVVDLNDEGSEEVRTGRADDGGLRLCLAHWEGPLDLLLTLARAQKVDLRQISILALVDQYLAYLESARVLHIELAADYLVMAAWLAFLKSCLLLPQAPGVEPSAEDLAFRLQLRLQRLDAMREAGARLMARDRLGREVFARGAPEGLRLIRNTSWQASPFDLIASFGAVRARAEPVFHVVADRAVMTLEDAIERVSRLVGASIDWTAIEAFVPAHGDVGYLRSALASSFVAALELARKGEIDLAQEHPFGPLLVRSHAG